MEIINNNKTEKAKNPATQPPGFLGVAARVIMGIIFFLCAATFLGFTIVAVTLPVVFSGFHFNFLGLDIIEGTLFVAELVCILCALGAALLAYLSFCVTFSKSTKGWVIALLLLLFVGVGIGGAIYGVKSGVNIEKTERDIERLEEALEGVDEDDVESIIRAVLSGQGKRSMTITMEDIEDILIISAMDVDSAIVERVSELILLEDEEVEIELKQDIDNDGVGTREVSIRLPDEDINITQTLPLTPLPSAKAE